VVTASGALGQTEASRKLSELIEDAWEYRLEHNPLFATSVGDYRYNDKLPSVSVRDQERRLRAERDFLKRVQSIDRSELTPDERVNAEIFERLKRDQVAEYTFRSYLIPITSREGFHVYFPQLPSQVPLNDVKDYEDYISRLEAFEDYAEQHIDLMKAGIEEGFTLPKVVLEGFESTLEPHIVSDPTESLLFAPFRVRRTWIREVPELHDR
jgi:uncharacterized protein (DUF885 family)